MFTEAIHTLVDCGNQAILGFGLRKAEQTPDQLYQYGYGRSAFFFSLLSALGTFGFGALYTGFHGLDTLINPPEALVALPETWAVLAASCLVDGYVLRTALKNIKERADVAGVSTWQWILSFKDPFTVAVVFEDSAAVSGVLIAVLGIGLTHYTGNVLWDGVASLCISAVLATVSLKLVALNHSFILGRVSCRQR